MADSLTKEKRSLNMASIKGKDTKPELAVRKYLHGQGLRYSLHRKDLPGTPDIVLPKWKAVVFVHGCYWHRHEGCKLAYTPKSNVSFWQEKFKSNLARDRNNTSALSALGWKVIVVWECEVRANSYQQYLVNKIKD